MTRPKRLRIYQPKGCLFAFTDRRAPHRETYPHMWSFRGRKYITVTGWSDPDTEFLLGLVTPKQARQLIALLKHTLRRKPARMKARRK